LIEIKNGYPDAISFWIEAYFASKSPPLQVLKKCDGNLTARTQLLPYTRISDEEFSNALEDK
ncbi:MAG: hypothetical protein V2J65_15715, partial [Desulfobacteraceae bacterium]|nr:hypothetical protein [Desulfobacteraceae bacterium]